MTEREPKFPKSELEKARRKIIATNTVLTEEEFQKLKGAIGKEVCDRFVRADLSYHIIFGVGPKLDMGEASFILEDFSLIFDKNTNKKYLVFLAESTRRHFPRFGLGEGRTIVEAEFTTKFVYLKDSGQVLWNFDKPTSTYLYRGKEFKDSDFPAVLKVVQSFRNFEKVD